MSHAQHKARAPASHSGCVLTVSDSCTPDTDASGRLILPELGHVVQQLGR